MRRTIHEGNQLLMKKPIESADSVLCRLYCIYVAHVINTNRFPIEFEPDDHDLIRFAKLWYSKLFFNDAFVKLYFNFFKFHSYQQQIFFLQLYVNREKFHIKSFEILKHGHLV